MKNRNCPNKDACWDYNASRCEGCAVGEKIARLARQNMKLKAENAELRARLEKAVELPTIYEHISYPYLERMYSETIYYVIYKENGRIMTEKFGKNKSKAEARLKELKEKKDD